MKISDAVKTVLTAGGKSQGDLADAWDVSKQAINNKLSRESFSGKDLIDLARLTGCRMMFEFSDGTRVVVDDPEE